MSNKIECPFIRLFGDEIDCPYIENFTYCHDVGITPGNGDAWCSKKIEEALNPPKQVCDACEKLMTDSLFTKNPNEDTLMQQKYVCRSCGLRGFVSSDVFTKIKEDHERQTPNHQCPIKEISAIRNPRNTLMRQNYSCNICGLKSFVIYDSKEDGFDIITKIEEGHKRKEPTCPCPINDLNIVGEPTKV